MSRGPWLFKQSDLERVIRSAKKQDLRNYSVVITHDGLSVIVGEQAKADSLENKANPWDEVLSNVADEERPA